MDLLKEVKVFLEGKSGTTVVVQVTSPDFHNFSFYKIVRVSKMTSGASERESST